MAKRKKTSINISKETDIQLRRIAEILGIELDNRSLVIEWMARKYTTEWAKENGIDIKDLMKAEEYQYGEDSLYSKRTVRLEKLEQERQLKLEKEKALKPLYDEDNKILNKAGWNIGELKDITKEKGEKEIELDLSDFEL